MAERQGTPAWWGEGGRRARDRNTGVWPGFCTWGWGSSHLLRSPGALKDRRFRFQVATLREKLRVYEAGAQDLPQPPTSGPPQQL